VPFLRRRQENEPGPPAPEPVPAAPPPEAPVVSEPPPAPEAQAELPVESQFQPVEGADEMLDMPLGTLIFRAGLIAPQQLEDALAEGLRSGKRLGEVLLSRGWLSEEDLTRLLAGQKGLPFADLDKIAIDRELAQAMSYDDARAEMALPVVSEFGVPVVAMADPDEAAMEQLRAQLGSEILFVVAAPSVLARLIDEILGGAPAPALVVAPAAAAPPSPDDLSAETVPPVTAPEPEPAVIGSTDQETPTSAPDLAAQETHPIITEGEVDYPTFSEYQPIPQPEMISGSEEQLPEEVQMGDYGYFDDPTLLEGNAWQAGEAGPPAAEPEPEAADLGAADLGADEHGADLEAEQPLEDEQPVETEQPLEDEPPLEEEQPLETEQPIAETSEEPAQESYPEAIPEPVEPDVEERAYEQLPEASEEVAGSSPGEEDLPVTTPAWMRGEVKVIAADVAQGEPEPVASDSETPVESAPAFEAAPESPVDDLEAAETPTAEAEVAEPVADEPMEAVEPTEPEPAGPEPGVEPPGRASEAAGAAEQVGASSAGDVSSEPAAASATDEEESAAGAGQGEFELVLRLADGDRIQIGSFGSIEKAQERAGEVVKQFADIKEGGGWPFIGGRFLRPETIVSIDVEQHGTGWGGSNSRGRMFSGDENA
jgi:Type II secretion system (T2SS), protein E, N-terminal domain